MWRERGGGKIKRRGRNELGRKGAEVTPSWNEKTFEIWGLGIEVLNPHESQQYTSQYSIHGLYD